MLAGVQKQMTSRIAGITLTRSASTVSRVSGRIAVWPPITMSSLTPSMSVRSSRNVSVARTESAFASKVTSTTAFPSTIFGAGGSPPGRWALGHERGARREQQERDHPHRAGAAADQARHLPPDAAGVPVLRAVPRHHRPERDATQERQCGRQQRERREHGTGDPERADRPETLQARQIREQQAQQAEDDRCPRGQNRFESAAIGQPTARHRARCRRSRRTPR